MPHAQQKLKNVAMKEVENVHAHNSDEFDDEMDVGNLVDIKIVRERGGLKHLRGIKRASNAPS